MGLDQYMTAQKFFWSVEKDEKVKRKEMTIKKLFPEMKGKKLDYVKFQVGYWRKANAIHRWFVDNVQGGEDDCKSYYVDEEQLQELLDVCKEVLKKVKTKKGKIHVSTSHSGGKETKNYEDGLVVTNPEVCEELLPSSSGFFFGGTEYNNFYLDDVKETIKILEECLELVKKGWDFEYGSSW